MKLCNLLVFTLALMSMAFQSPAANACGGPFARFRAKRQAAISYVPAQAAMANSASATGASCPCVAANGSCPCAAGFANPIPASQMPTCTPTPMPSAVGNIKVGNAFDDWRDGPSDRPSWARSSAPVIRNFFNGVTGGNCPGGVCPAPAAGRTFIVPASSTPTVVTFGF